jgi:hypothetical protein
MFAAGLAAGLGFIHSFCGNAVEKDRSRRGNIRILRHIARTAQFSVNGAKFVFSTSYQSVEKARVVAVR